MRNAHFIEVLKNAQDALRAAHLVPRIEGMSFGSKIKELRIRQKLTLADVETRAGLADGNLSRIERGKQWVTEDKLNAIANALGVPVYELFTDDSHHISPVDAGARNTDNMVELSSLEHDWLQLLEHLGSDDIAEFMQAARQRQERNIRLIEELENHLHPARRKSAPRLESSLPVLKKQSSQSS